MEASKVEMCKSLVEWFMVVMENDLPSSNEPDLSDGVAMARALHKFSPDFFTGNFIIYIIWDQIVCICYIVLI